ncbi:MAG: adenylate/guanylate cyclase domain-containing protein [Synergistaceae bacterium]|nr:adenylate/guanylate cyclase domain-containing protein [Synergistaceae bacterium]
MGVKNATMSQRLKQFMWCVLPGVAATVLVLWVFSSQPDLIKRFDLRIYDKFLERTSGGEPSDVPILIDIDEKSLQRYGQWPWSRYRAAQLLAKLYGNGVAAIGVDILMSEPDRTSPSLVIDQIKKDFNVDIKHTVFPKDLLDNDLMFANVLGQISAVMSSFISNSSSDIPASPVPSLRLSEIRASGAPSLIECVPNGLGLTMPLPVLSKAARGVGFMNAEGDIDGLFRRLPLFMSYDGKLIPSLALATLSLAAGGGSKASQLMVKMDVDGPSSVKFSDITIPMSHEGSLPVMFRRRADGAGTDIYPRYSACDVIEGRVGPDLLNGKIAFVGSTVAGLKDLRPTPFDNAYPGLELHAALVDTILSGRFLTVPQWLPGAEFLITLAVGIFAMLLFGLAPPVIYVSLSIAAAFAVWQGTLWQFTNKGMFFSPTYPFLALALNGFFITGMRFWLEDKSKRVLKKAFSNYVSPEVVSQIMAKGSAASLQGEQRDITIIFTDIRGFTSLTEKLQPTQVVELLGRYFTPMTAIVRESGGTLDKFVGDAMMAFWNAPIDVPEHPRRAVQALLDMHTKLDELNVSLEADMGVRLAMGGGIHTGQAHVGNMGTEDLMDYTAIGDTVNTASRVEGMCSKYGSGAVVSGETRALCADDFAWQRIDTVRVKGRTQGVELWQPMTFDEAAARKDELELWAEAFAHYEKGEFSEARKICAQLAEKFDKIKLYKIFEERCAELMENAPENWDGILKYDTK